MTSGTTAFWLMRSMLCLLAAALAVLVGPAATAQPTAEQHVTVSVTGPQALPTGKPFELAVHVRVAKGYHIQADNAPSPYVPARVSVTAPAGFSVGAPVFPKSTSISILGQIVPVFEGDVTVRVPVTQSAGATAGPFAVSVRYQACTAINCFAPTEATAAYAPGGSAAPAPAARPAPAAAGRADVPGYRVSLLQTFVGPEEFTRFLSTGSTDAGQSAGALGKLLGAGNLLLALPLIFLLGLALNLTPCVYPLIPITLGYFGAQSQGRQGKPLGLALLYVLGMALMYSALGVAAGMTGRLFGSQLQSPWVLAGFAVVMFALALSQFDRPNGMPIWELQMPNALRGTARSRGGGLGALFMGMLVGVVAAPCIGPAVVALLQWVGTQRSPVLGFACFFVLALGLGLPYVVLAMVSGGVRKLPRSGEWLTGVKHIFGVLLAWMGFYYLQPVLNLQRAHLGDWLLVAATVLGAVYLLADRSGSQAAGFRLFRTALGVGALVLAVWLVKPVRGSAIVWQAYDPASFEQARLQGRPILIDFTASWCAACKELEHKTFSDPRVGHEARDYVAFRADMTDFNGPQAEKLKRQFGIVGLPTVARLVPNRQATASR